MGQGVSAQILYVHALFWLGGHKQWRILRIIRAGIGVFSLFGLIKVMFVPKTSDTTATSLHQTPKENQEIATLYNAILHYFV